MIIMGTKSHQSPASRPFRMTVQRQLILDHLRAGGTWHPTADEVHQRVRRRMPHISLATVYRNLETMSAQGLVRKLQWAGTQKRFDWDTAPHDHVRCLGCGCVADARIPPAGAMERAAQEMSGYQIIGHWLEFVGLCPRCTQLNPGLAGEMDELPAQRGRPGVSSGGRRAAGAGRARAQPEEGGGPPAGRRPQVSKRCTIPVRAEVFGHGHPVGREDS